MSDLLTLIRDALPAYGIAAAPETMATWARFLERVIEANQRLRLVGSAEPEVLVRRHLCESLFLATRVRLDGRRSVDVGSGAGFPGLALAIGWPSLISTLVESTQKKAAFLQLAIDELELANCAPVVATFVDRRPAATTPAALRVVFSAANLITVRALERMTLAPEWLGRWLEPGTQVAFWVGREMAKDWHRRFGDGTSGWQWGEFHLLPGARERGIQLGYWNVPRGTLAEP